MATWSGASSFPLTRGTCPIIFTLHRIRMPYPFLQLVTGMTTRSAQVIALTSALFFCPVIETQGQLISISDGSATACSGVLYDSGGQGAAGYSNDEDLVLTLCPDDTSASVVLSFITFDLDISGPQNTWDNLSIHDGENTSATLLGVYTETSLQGISVSATTFNATGCLTLRFRSNTVGTGVFAATISCTSDCDAPTAAATMSLLSPARVCVGSSVTLDASASFSANGEGIGNYHWQFGQSGSLDTGSAVIEHTFDTPGWYPLGLVVTDSTGCESTNAIALEVFVSTAPSFTLNDLDSAVCIGQEIVLAGSAQAEPWSATSVGYGPGVYLPDDVGLPFTSEMILTGYEAGAVIASESDIASICVEMEHSYMGDLVLQVFCPNGQTVMLHQQSGGGTYVGSPNDMDSNSDPEVGECWQYCWSPTATNGTWFDNSQQGANPNTMVGGVPAGQSLVPGTYQSTGPMSDLIGCPFNGTWTFQSTDLWGADNGFLCGWSMSFATEVGGDTSIFTPTYGSGCDSTFWSGTSFAWTDQGCDSVLFVPEIPGPLELTYTAINNFGCTFEQVVTMEILEASDPLCAGIGITESEANGILVQPNPTTGPVLLTCDIPMQGFRLIDLDGRTVLGKDGLSARGSVSIDLRSIPAGVYVLEVSRGDGSAVRQRLVRE